MALVLLCVTLSLLCVFCVSAEYGPCTAFFVLFFFFFLYVLHFFTVQYWHQDVCFSMPLCRSKVEQVAQEVLIELSEMEKQNFSQVNICFFFPTYHSLLLFCLFYFRPGEVMKYLSLLFVGYGED